MYYTAVPYTFSEKNYKQYYCQVIVSIDTRDKTTTEYIFSLIWRTNASKQIQHFVRVNIYEKVISKFMYSTKRSEDYEVMRKTQYVKN